MEPQQMMDDAVSKICEITKPLEPAIEQLKNLMKPIESKIVDGCEVHRMTGNIIMIKAKSQEQQKELFEQLK